ncbi:hypothetical protein GCM10023085_44360 [Actinomadura viridis]
MGFARYRDGRTMVMGDLVVTEGELEKVTDAFQAGGLEQTAIHKHLLAHTPQLWWAHFDGVDRSAVRLARAVRAALDVTATPGPPAPRKPPPLDLDTAAIDGGQRRLRHDRERGEPRHQGAAPRQDRRRVAAQPRPAR